MYLKNFIAIVSCSMFIVYCATVQSQQPTVDPDGTVHVKEFEWPMSSFLSEETIAALKRQNGSNIWLETIKNCPSMDNVENQDWPAIRECQKKFFNSGIEYKSMKKRFDVKISSEVMGGVYTEIFTPTAGIKKSNRNMVLINVHGGGFSMGSRSASHVESIPIASVGGIKVISVDYRLSPENQFPAISADVEKVYREVLKHYKPENIGLYGCSAGAAITAQSIAWFIDKNLPLPAAIGMFCLGAITIDDFVSDAGAIQRALSGYDMGLFFQNHAYLSGIEPDNSLAYPGSSPSLLSKFPPSLLISATRDLGLSSVVKTHTELNRLGVEAELFVWEGLEHAFHIYSDLPESREAYDVIVKFFDKHLGKK